IHGGIEDAHKPFFAEPQGFFHPLTIRNIDVCRAGGYDLTLRIEDWPYCSPGPHRRPVVNPPPFNLLMQRLQSGEEALENRSGFWCATWRISQQVEHHASEQVVERSAQQFASLTVCSTDARVGAHREIGHRGFVVQVSVALLTLAQRRLGTEALDLSTGP